MSRYLTKLIDVVSNEIMTDAITSKAIHAKQARTIGLTIIFTGSPTGTFTVEASNDETNWIELVFTEGAITAAGSPGSHALTLKEYPYEFIRVLYAFTSGTGSLNVQAKMKG